MLLSKSKTTPLKKILHGMLRLLMYPLSHNSRDGLTNSRQRLKIKSGTNDGRLFSLNGACCGSPGWARCTGSFAIAVPSRLRYMVSLCGSPPHSSLLSARADCICAAESKTLFRGCTACFGLIGTLEVLGVWRRNVSIPRPLLCWCSSTASQVAASANWSWTSSA